MDKRLLLIFGLLLLGSWFVIGESKSFMEKLGLLLAVIVLYIAFRLMTGASMDEIIAPFLVK